jgi:hypothetical protein
MHAGDQLFFIGYLVGKTVQVMMKTLLQVLLDIYLMAPSAGGSRGHCRQAVNVQGEKDIAKEININRVMTPSAGS